LEYCAVKRRKAQLLAGISITALLFFAVSLAATAGHGPGGARSGGHAVSVPHHSGGLGGHAIGGIHSGGIHFGGRSFSRQGFRSIHSGAAGAHFSAGVPRTFATAGATARLTHTHAVFGNRSIGNAAFKSSFGHHHPIFFGHFHGSPWPWWWGGVVIGWIGPVFWPYAYYDFFDYVFWPYAYDDFWPYAYEDIYYGVWGDYAYVDPAMRATAGRARIVRSTNSEQRPVGVCGENAPELTNWPIERISQVVEPNEAQRATLDELKSAAGKSIGILKSSCPNDLPSTPTGRMAGMEGRLKVMLEAVQTVRQPLDRFFALLSDEQKARFNAVAPANPSAAKKDQHDLTQLCSGRAASVGELPIDRIAQAVGPTDTQQAALEELRAASAKAAENLKSNCPNYQPLTPAGRVEAMEQRLTAMLAAIAVVQPALTKFYDSLTFEQRARFNTLGALRA
jgi:hypothetical protein